MEIQLKENQFLAALWLLLALVTSALAFYSLITPGKYLMPSGLCLAAILFLMARQRLGNYSLETSKFRTYIRNISLFMVFCSCIGVVVVSNV